MGLHRIWWVGLLCGVFAILASSAAAEQSTSVQGLEQRMAVLEIASGGRLGIAALDSGTGVHFECRASERFAMCSTFKFVVAGAILARVDAGQESLERPIAYSESDLLDYAPACRRHLAEGSMTVRALCAAAVEESDNTAANLLLKVLGGPDGFTRYVRSLGDHVTRLDRDEPSLNTNLIHDERDTTSPAAMLQLARRLLLGDALSAELRAVLAGWLESSRTGAARIRAAVPQGWRVGDKSGSGENGASNDIAIIWPPGRQPILLVVYFSESTAPAKARDGVIAEAAQMVLEAFSAAQSLTGARAPAEG